LKVVQLKLTNILFVALILLVIVNSGCVGFVRNTYFSLLATPTPSPTATPVPTPDQTPVNATLQREYLFVQNLDIGLNSYNNGITAMNDSRRASEVSDWTNASSDIWFARSYMDQAQQSFLAMVQYAGTPAELSLCDKWNETAYYYSLAFGYVNQSYAEGAYQATQSIPNYVLENYYVNQANYYIGLAVNSRQQAIALENETFIGQQG
jgi:hypothetical protein